MNRRRAIRALIFAALFAAALAPARAAAQDSLAEAVKATFLYRFASFVDWPTAAFSGPDAPLTVCVSGAPDFAGLVERAASGERVGGRAISVRRMGAVPRGSGCHILYVGVAEGQSVAEALRTVRGEPVLTVTDAAIDTTRGGVHFVLDRGRVRFHIDRGQVEANGLVMSSRLMSVALSVRRRGGSGAR